ncbi:MAG TPA: VOC family protein [Thermohalobaculum sp.]|nr:VOC family protein [Thermohalobaculum sp.]
MASIRLDHLVIGAASLAEGRAWAEARLGVPPGGGGVHAAMGTHNALWGLGDCYLEVIAVDPQGARPDRPRWFGFDDPAVQARLAQGPCLLTWAVAVDDIGALRPPLPHDAPQDFARDDLRWKVRLPQGAALPLGGAWPLTIQWTDGLHPAKRLPDQGLRLERLEIAGAAAAEAEAALGAVAGPVAFAPGDGQVRLTATLRTPAGVVSL